MTLPESSLPISETVAPSSIDEVADVIRNAAESGQAIYPVGGGTSLDHGLPAKQPGQALSLEHLNQIVDYPAGDMTITVQAGMRMSALQERLRDEGQQLPIDVPHADQATIGGVLATNADGPRRFGFGTIRDYVIGIRAVDGRGSSFAGGGRVVKNVAGYDFCKLLVGSLGTLGVITEVTLKVKPRSACRAIIVGQPRDLGHAEEILSAMIDSQIYPAALELIGGATWHSHTYLRGQPERDWLVAVIEGTDEEVEWMSKQLHEEWAQHDLSEISRLEGSDRDQLYQGLIEFSGDKDAALLLKANVVPSGTTAVIEAARKLADSGDTSVSVQAHAGNGIVYLQFSDFPSQGMSRTLTGSLRPVAIAHRGNVIVISNPSGQEMTRQSVWGGIDEPFWMMDRIKEQFDPLKILNPGRYVYS